MRATLMVESGWCGFGIGRGEIGFVICLGGLRITACVGRISDRIAGYEGALADAVMIARNRNATPEQKAREAGAL